jgi:hypothetical protein
MKLIKEEVLNVEYFTESTSSGRKNHFIQGIFMQAEQKNRNGRVYPLHVLEKEVNRYTKDYVEKNRAVGELGHPDSPAINLDRVSHKITEIVKEGNNFIGKAQILNTPHGKTVKSLLEGGVSLGVSTRGVGTLKPANGYQLVQDDFHLATAADIVADPSAPDAFVQGIMENCEWLLTPNGWQAIDLERGRRSIREASQGEIETVALRLFENFISKL